MKTLTNAYVYSKSKSQAMFSSKKQKKMTEETRGCAMFKMCRAKFEATKNASYEYMVNIYNMVKSTGKNAYTHISTFTIKTNEKYANYPWYTRIYLVLKDNIKRIMKIEDWDVPMDTTGKKEKTEEMQTEEPQSTFNATPDTSNNHITSDEHTAQNAHVSQYHSDIIIQRNKNYLKRTNSEVLEERVNDVGVEKTHSSNFNLSSRSRTASLINSIMSLNKFTNTVEEKKPTYDTEDVTEPHKSDDVNDTATAADHFLEIGTTKSSATANMAVSNKSDSDKTYISDMTDSKRKNFNIKSAWTKFNNLLI